MFHHFVGLAASSHVLWNVMRGRRHALAVAEAIARLLHCETAAAGALPTAALRAKSKWASASSTAGEAAARDAQQSDRDGRAPPFSGAKSARLPFPRLRRRSPPDEFGGDGRPRLGWDLLLCEAAAAVALPTAAPRLASRRPARASRACYPRRKLLRGTRSRATGTVALPLSQERLIASFFIFFRQIAHRGLGA